MNTQEIKAILAPLIKPELLQQAYDAGVTDEAIFTQQLYIVMKQRSPGTLIQYPWQLLALGSKLKDMKGFKDWEQQDNLGAFPAHYVAWSGSLDDMKWVVGQDKVALTRKTNVGSTIAHYAAFSGNQALLEWLLDQDSTILGITNGPGFTIAHFAVQSRNPAILDWLVHHDPAALSRDDNYSRTPMHIAAWSGIPAQLNKVLQLTNTYIFDGYSFISVFTPSSVQGDRDKIFKGLVHAMATNFALIEVHAPKEIGQQTYNSIKALVKRNKLLMAGLNSFEPSGMFGSFFSKSARGQNALSKRALDLKRRACSLENDEEKQQVFKEILELSQAYWAKELHLNPDVLDSPVDILSNYLGQFGEEVNSSPTPQQNAIKNILAEVEKEKCEDDWEEILKIIEKQNTGASSVPDSIIEYFKYRAILGIPGNLGYALPGPSGSINSDP